MSGSGKGGRSTVDLLRQGLLGSSDTPITTNLLGKPPLPNLLDAARLNYPVLNNYPTEFKVSPNAQPFMLEHWSPNTTDNGLGYARPKEIPNDQYGVEVYSDKTKPADVAADIVSHRLVNEDPIVKQTYQHFEGSLTDNQQRVLREQYDYARKHESESEVGPYDEWYKRSGLPAMFRGYAFKQWPDQFNDRLYTAQQKQAFDQMMNYLRGSK